ncbi:hypothetical protein KY321_05780 [Candidatus Woesearchaeota archaeon]|nr:hypothetical protein [Candidatus Woesearchaeota archaeon]
MNKILKRFLLGLLIWAVPFFGSFFVWDFENNIPLISMNWLNALTAFFWAIAFGIAACIYFRKIKKNAEKEGWKTGFFWYIELVALDFLVLVGAFKMPIGDFYPVFLTYMNVLIITIAIGHIKKK